MLSSCKWEIGPNLTGYLQPPWKGYEFHIKIKWNKKSK